jgi:hypothetical protein
MSDEAECKSTVSEVERVHPERGGAYYSEQCASEHHFGDAAQMVDHRVTIAAALAKQHREVSESHGERWTEVVTSHRGVITEAMEIRGTANPLVAGVALAADILRRGQNPETILAVAVEIANEMREIRRTP